MAIKGNEKNVKVAKPVGHILKKPEGDTTKVANPFYIVGMGGSAGGLEAFEQFFRNMPPDAGIAFVVISHLDPTRKGSMPELIQRFTKMPVMEATEGVRVAPDHVYVIPSNKDISISGGNLTLTQPLTPRGPRMPIDLFMRSLANDRGEMAVGVIFSGMGSDGTLGIKAIKEHLGMVMSEDPTSARFDSMPKNAVNTGVVDYVATPAELPDYLLEYAKASHAIYGKSPAIMIKAPTLLDKIFKLIRNRTGHDFSVYKTSTLYRRIERRMSVHHITSIPEYIHYMESHHAEIDALFKELLIGVTSFFRDPEAFHVLEEKAIPEMLNNKPEGSIIRIWVPGCSTGEEAFSIAIIMAEALGDRRDKVQIFATDIDKDAIETARKGKYPDNIVADVPAERLRKYFVQEDNYYKVKKSIRDMVVFAEQDVIGDPPFTNLDLVSCRNLLIYLTPEVQKKVLLLFSYSLNPGGILFLGPSESIGQINYVFNPLDNKWKIFKRREYLSKRAMEVSIPIGTSAPIDMASIRMKTAEPNVTELAQLMLLEYFSPPAVLINDEGDIVYFSGRTGKYLEPSPGKANMNINLMARPGLKTELSLAIKRSEREKRDVVVNGLEVRTNGDKQTINLIVKPLAYPEALKNFMLIVFQDTEAKRSQRVSGKRSGSLDLCKELGEELNYTKERLQTTQEEMTASQEELKSMNEELQSTNEELQSTNEELTTSKEELQSLNEELTTVNSELQAKIDDLTHSNNDMKNLLNSTEIATIFLDNHLNITRYTPEATKVVKLIPGDIGRPITDIVSNIKEVEITEDAQKVIKSLIPVGRQIPTKDGRWYDMRIIPYRTVENVIDGIVLTFNDISRMKRLEESARTASDYAESIIATVREPLLVMDGDMKVISANKSYYRDFKVAPRDTIGHTFFELGNGLWDIPSLRTALEEMLPGKKELSDFKVEHDFPHIGHRVMLLNAREIKADDDKGLILIAFEDITGKGLPA